MSEKSLVKANENGQLNYEQLAKKVESMKPDTSVDLVSSYWTIEPGEEAKVVFVENTTMAGFSGDGDVPAVKLLVKDGSIVTNADKVLVSTFKDKKAPFPALVICTGTEKGKNGSYKKFSVHPLVD